MSSRILAPESIPCSVLLAKELGRSAATFLQQLHYWLTKSNHLIEGVRWVFNSAQQWSEQLGLSTATITRAIALLREQGLIRVERWSKQQWHQVNWYTIDYEALQALIESIQSNCADQSAQIEADESGKMPDSYQETSTADSLQHSGEKIFSNLDPNLEQPSNRFKAGNGFQFKNPFVVKPPHLGKDKSSAASCKISSTLHEGQPGWGLDISPEDYARVVWSRQKGAPMPS